MIRTVDDVTVIIIWPCLRVIKVIKHQMEKMRVMLEGENITVKATGQYSSHEDDEDDIDSYEKVP